MDTIKSIITELFQDIKTKNPSSYKVAFEVLVKLFSNIVENPQESKFRNLKKTNEIIKTKVLIIPEIEQVLSIIGYTEGENKDFMIYEGDSIDNLKDAIEVLRSLIDTSSFSSSSSTFNVKVLQYDLSNGLATQMSPMLVGKRIEGVWHTGIVVFGVEYFYGGGICRGEPRKTPYGKPVKEIEFGVTGKTKEEFEKYLKSLETKYNVSTYNVLYNNCNHFTDTALYFLTGKHLPDSILKQHEQLLNSPIGAMLKPMLENMSRQNNQFLPGMFEGR